MCVSVFQLCLSASIVRRDADSVSSEETSSEDFQSVKNDLAKLLTKDQNKQLDGILEQFSSNTTTLDQKVDSLVWTLPSSLYYTVHMVHGYIDKWFHLYLQAQLFGFALTAATANVEKAVNGSTTESQVAENKIWAVCAQFSALNDTILELTLWNNKYE